MKGKKPAKLCMGRLNITIYESNSIHHFCLFYMKGVLTGFNVYAKVSSQPSRPVYFGIYRPVANTSCTFTLLKLWHPIITDLNKVTQVMRMKFLKHI